MRRSAKGGSYGFSRCFSPGSCRCGGAAGPARPGGSFLRHLGPRDSSRPGRSAGGLLSRRADLPGRRRRMFTQRLPPLHEGLDELRPHQAPASGADLAIHFLVHFQRTAHGILHLVVLAVAAGVFLNKEGLSARAFRHSQRHLHVEGSHAENEGSPFDQFMSKLARTMVADVDAVFQEQLTTFLGGHQAWHRHHTGGADFKIGDVGVGKHSSHDPVGYRGPARVARAHKQDIGPAAAECAFA